MRRRLFNLLTALSLLLCAIVLMWWLHSYEGAQASRLGRYELFAVQGELYLWSGERSMVLRLHFMPLLLISLALPLLRLAASVDRYRKTGLSHVAVRGYPPGRSAASENSCTH